MVRLSIVLILILANISCATIMQGTTQKIGVSSSPSGAKVFVDGVEKGVTPTIIEVSREEHILTLRLEGHEERSQPLTAETMSGWVWGNIIFGGIIGLAFDLAAKGVYLVSPEQYNGEMKKIETKAVTASAPSI